MKQEEKDLLLNDICTRLPYGVEHMIGLKSPDYYQGKMDALNDTLFLLDTLEMKVDACYESILKLQ